MFAKLSGYKTYVFAILFCVIQMAEQAGVIPANYITMAHLLETLFGTSTVIAHRAGVQKAEDAAKT
jgi:hypothetical protein